MDEFNILKFDCVAVVRLVLINCPCISCVAINIEQVGHSVGHYTSLHCCRKLQPHSRWSCISLLQPIKFIISG